jgi:hypothetical protein
MVPPFGILLVHHSSTIQKVQNACLCAVTGCHTAASIQHLHDECRMLQVCEHLDMQSSQFLLNTRQSTHPSHDVTGWPPGPGPDRKPTLQHRYNRDIDQYTNNGVKLAINYKKDIKSHQCRNCSFSQEGAELCPRSSRTESSSI